LLLATPLFLLSIEIVRVWNSIKVNNLRITQSISSFFDESSANLMLLSSLIPVNFFGMIKREGEKLTQFPSIIIHSQTYSFSQSFLLLHPRSLSHSNILAYHIVRPPLKQEQI
jgi:hypothetical protein